MAPCVLPYPDRFNAAAEYTKGLDSKDQAATDETRLLMYALLQQANEGPCTASTSWFGNAVENAKLTTWKNLGKMDKFEAMRLYVKVVEEEHPDWWDLHQAKQQLAESAEAAESLSPAGAVVENGIGGQEVEKLDVSALTPVEDKPFSQNRVSPPLSPRTAQNNALPQALAMAASFNQWTSATPAGRRPRQRYQHAAVLKGDSMLVVGGNSWGRYFNDTQVLDLNSMAWSKLEVTGPSQLHPCAGHCLVDWCSRVLLVGGHMKKEGAPSSPRSNSLSVLELDMTTNAWKDFPISVGTQISDGVPCARGGHSSTLFGSKLVVFGGEDINRKVLDELHVLDLQSGRWSRPQTTGTRPQPRADHVATNFNNRYLYVFGGGSSTRCFNDLYCLDMTTMTWTTPATKGESPSARAGHSGVVVGGNHWYITGGGDSTSGVADTALLDLSSLTWSTAFTTGARDNICSEGLSLVAVERGTEQVLLSFGGYNGKFTNDIHTFRICPPGGHLPQADTTADLEEQIQLLQARVAETERKAEEKIKETLLQSKEQEEQAEKQLNLIQAQLANMNHNTQDIQTQVASLSQRNGELEAELASALEAASLAERERAEERESRAQALREAESAADSRVSDAVARADAACLEMKKSEESLERANARILELEAAASAGASAQAQLQAAETKAQEAETQLFKMEVNMAELRNKIEEMDMLESELKKVQKQLATAKEEAQKRQSGGIWGIVTGS